jgi:hypothetical protein
MTSSKAAPLIKTFPNKLNQITAVAAAAAANSNNL